jgi:hypothetical protein
VRSRVVAATLILGLAAGCGAPATVEKQAEEVGSIAAEGALLAHDASEGDTTKTFTRVHARELAKKAEQLVPKIRSDNLERVTRSVVSGLERLADDPGDERGAEELEQRLDDAAKRAEEIGKAAS